MIQYGVNFDNQKLVHEKAKTKNDGVYSFRGIVYKVYDKKVVYLVDCDGTILKPFGSFNVVSGKCPSIYQSEKIKYLKGF